MVTFNEAWQQKVDVTIDELQIPFIHNNHLIASKITSSRLKDIMDIEELQKINRKDF